METIQDVRRGLRAIPNCLTDFPPEDSYRGTEPGTPVSSIWSPQDIDKSTEQRGAYDTLGGSGSEDDHDLPSKVPPRFDPLIEIGADIDEKHPLLGGASGEIIRGSILERGTDALAWYLSFHVTGRQWGIYVPMSGIAYLCRNVFHGLDAPLMAKAHLAFHALLAHELFHFATDCVVAQSELLHQEPWWRPAKTAFRSGPPYYGALEEKLANAYMLRMFRTMKQELRLTGKQAALRRFTTMQPEGYRDAVKVRKQHWSRELASLAQAYGQHSRLGAAHPAIWTRGSGYDWASQFQIWPRIDWRYCPIHLVNDSERMGIPPGWLSICSRLESISETEGFLRSLMKLGSQVSEAWKRTKSKLLSHITPGLDLKKWPKDGPTAYSVRLNDNYRAHLLKGASAIDTWTAIKVGTHKEMGHG